MLFLILILELSVSIAAYSMRGNLEPTLKANMLETMDDYQTYTYHTWKLVQYNVSRGVLHSLSVISRNKLMIVVISPNHNKILIYFLSKIFTHDSCLLPVSFVTT
nr:unnamed protein product [Callosobruchus chinensis]